MLNYGIGAPERRKSSGAKKKSTPFKNAAAPAATAVKSAKKKASSTAAAVKIVKKKVATAKKSVIAAEKAVEKLKSFQKRRLKDGTWASYGKSNQEYCSTAGKLLRKMKTRTASLALHSCRVR